MKKENLAALAAMSNRYGSDPAYVLAGGGNTSYKEKDVLFIKGSGTALATIKAEEFVGIDREKLGAIWGKTYPEKESEREAAVLADMMASRLPGETRRPSVETLLHDLFPYSFVLHVHPATVNGLTCSKEGKKAAAELFPDAVWIENSKPGYLLAALCRGRLAGSVSAGGGFPKIVFLENHGIFFAADTTGEIDVTVARVMKGIAGRLSELPDASDAPVDLKKAEEIAAKLAGLCGEGGTAFVKHIRQRSLLGYDPLTGSLTPDHIVYCKAKPLIIRDGEDIASAFSAYRANNGYKPKVVYCRGLGAFCLGNNEREAEIAAEVFWDAVKITVYARSFGGVSPMPRDLEDFIVNWEVESYRSKVKV
ncbi:MAG: class II aldolase [Clostridia bacterium]|nr:class II aldolase [Clostridia bacterium]